MRLYSVYYISVGSSTRFGCLHPSSEARTAVITASGTGQMQWITYAATNKKINLSLYTEFYVWFACMRQDITFKKKKKNVAF